MTSYSCSSSLNPRNPKHFETHNLLYVLFTCGATILARERERFRNVNLFGNENDLGSRNGNVSTIHLTIQSLKNPEYLVSVQH